MGYSIYHSDASLGIKKENIDKMLSEKFPECKDVNQWLDDISCSADFNENGDIIEFYVERDKLGCFDDIVKDMAPYVDDESYIEMLGEDNNLWRYAFYGGKCYDISPIIVWPEPWKEQLEKEDLGFSKNQLNILKMLERDF